MRKICDTLYAYRPPTGRVAQCRLRIYEPESTAADQRPLVIATELAANPGMSITNAVETLAQQVWHDLLPHTSSFIWVEHYPPRYPDRDGRPTVAEDFSAVTFHLSRSGHLSNPRWRPLPRPTVEVWIGHALDEEPATPNEPGSARGGLQE